MKKAISFGAGVNSIAMTIMLFKRGEIYPVIFADTMAEHPETYCYMDYFEKEFMSKYGQKIVRISARTHPNYYFPRNIRQGIDGLEHFCLTKKMVPLAFMRSCTADYKIKPLAMWQKENNIDSALIAFAFDESHRAKNVKGNEGYPLIEKRITRKDCLKIIEGEGLDRPHKSGCFFCPFQRKSSWERLHKEYPELYNRAEKMENQSQTTIIPAGKSLSILRDSFENQTDMFPDWDFEELEPCMCKL